jgi:hypothetical protein
MRARPLSFLAALTACVLLARGPAHAGNAPVGGGGSCPGMTISEPVASTQGQQQAFDNGLYTCTGTAWAAEALIVGNVMQDNSAPTCNATNAGLVKWTGSALQYCDGTNFQTISSSGNGALTLISTQVASSSASLSWTGLGSTYNNYVLVCSSIIPATNNATCELQFGEGATPTWETANYKWASYIADSTPPSSSTAGSTSDASIHVDSTTNVASGAMFINATLLGIPSTTTYKTVLFQAIDGGTNVFVPMGGGQYTGDTNAVTAVRVLFSSGNISSGTCSLYGISK